MRREEWTRGTCTPSHEVEPAIENEPTGHILHVPWSAGPVLALASRYSPSRQPHTPVSRSVCSPGHTVRQPSA
eukprot:1237331-Prymnesium_polylepis.4